jgi:hypothetical protein
VFGERSIADKNARNRSTGSTGTWSSPSKVPRLDLRTRHEHALYPHRTFRLCAGRRKVIASTTSSFAVSGPSWTSRTPQRSTPGNLEGDRNQPGLVPSSHSRLRCAVLARLLCLEGPLATKPNQRPCATGCCTPPRTSPAANAHATSASPKPGPRPSNLPPDRSPRSSSPHQPHVDTKSLPPTRETIQNHGIRRPPDARTGLSA